MGLYYYREYIANEEACRELLREIRCQMGLNALVAVKRISGSLELMTTLNTSALNASTNLRRLLELYSRRPEHLLLNGFWQSDFLKWEYLLIN